MAPSTEKPAGGFTKQSMSNAQTWGILEAGVERVMTRLTEGIDMPTYMKLYTAVHDFCTSQKGNAHTTQSTLSPASAQRGAHLLGEDLYNHLIEYLQGHLKIVLDGTATLSDEALLTYYIKEWKRYTMAATYINHLFRYLNRHWVKREMDEGKKNIYDIYTLHLVRWRDDLFKHTQGKVMRAVLALAHRQRDGETIDHSNVKAIVESFSALGIDESDSTKGTLEVYQNFFQNPFIEETRRYYSSESKQFLAENPVVEYMKKAETRINEEREHVALFLHPTIMTPLMKACYDTLITDHSQILREEFDVLLNNDRIEDLGRMYKLLQRIEGGLDPLRSRFEKHVTAVGNAAVDKVAKEAGEGLEPKAYVEALLTVHKQYYDLVSKAFAGEPEFVRSLDSACRQYVNNNSVCNGASSKSPELLAKYTDNLLKKAATNAQDDDLEKLLDDIMIIFKYVHDKDVYQKFYQRHLAKRLVNSISASDDAELSMIGKLKEACGYEYTNKLQRMYQDMQISRDLNASFKDHQESVGNDRKSGIDAAYSVLASGMWPLSAPNTPFTPSPEIVKACERFNNFYTHKHNGRKLTWLWQLCKGEIKANYIKSPGKVPYTFQVSTYQLAILMMFNDAANDTVSYDDMAATTSLNRETLDPSIGVCVKAKVLLPIPENATPQSGTSYKLNTNYKSKKLKVNLNITIKSESKAEVEETHKTIAEDRSYVIQSAIVRIMKSRKKLKYTLLQQETIQQISQRFKPDVQDIKKQVDVLLEKEYIERLEDGEIGYLA